MPQWRCWEVGADLAEFQALLAPRLATLEEDFITPLDGLRRAVQEAERTLLTARQHEQDQTKALWTRYQTDYERHLRPPAVDESPEDRGPTSDEIRTPVDGSANGVEERPETGDAPEAEPILDRPAEVV
jgi:hypothetical protein